MGYADLWLNNALQSLANVKPGSYFLELAQEHERPYIFASEQAYRYNGAASIIELRVPKTQRLGIIVSQLLLLAVDVQNQWDVGRIDGVVAMTETSRNRFFYFKGEGGKALFEHWLGQCQTDPVFRIALKVPPATTT